MNINLENDATFATAQEDMRRGYLSGGPGILISGIVWLIAGVVGLVLSVQTSVFTLFFGGMLIYPLSMVIAKLFGRSGSHQPGNPLARLAIESTFLLFIGLFLAFSIVQVQPEWFFPVMLMVIGGRYLTFSTIYGMRIYWLVGAILAIAGGLLMLFSDIFIVGAFIGGIVEVCFAIIIIIMAKQTETGDEHPDAA